MSIEIRLSTTLRDIVPGYEPEKGLRAELAPGEENVSAALLAARIGIPDAQIKIIMVNGRQSKRETVVRDGDRVAYFPAVGGG
ncbi:MAG: MoaD/ThiS family protein [Desulfovibrionaceae bacterium]|nr:MoaD/ThiS family protein [Desulfovibrionaceae bacterium]